MRAAKEFNLSLIELANEVDNEMGVWDGNQFVLMVRCISHSALVCY